MPDADRTFKQHDLFPPLQATLSDQDGPIDLTTATAVKLLMKAGATLVSGRCTVVDAANGVVRYDWVRGDTDTVGDYEVEFEITWPSSLPETVPNDGYRLVSIMADLG